MLVLLLVMEHGRCGGGGMVVSGLLGGVSSCCSCSCSSCRWVGIGRAGLQQAARRRRHVGGERPLARDLDGRLVAVEDGMLVLWVLLGRRLVGVVVLDGPRAGGAGSAGIVDGELRDKVLECYLRLAQGASLWERDLRPLWLDAGVLDEMEQRLGRDGRGLHDLGQKVDLLVLSPRDVPRGLHCEEFGVVRRA